MQISLCEQAANNPDGTFSITRGGLSHWSIDEKVAFIVFVDCTAAEVPFGSQHAFMLSWVGCGADGSIAGYLGSPSPDATVARFVLPLIELHPRTHGDIVLTMKIGGHEASASITIKPSMLA